MTEKFNLRDWAEWTSSSQGFYKTKIAECVMVIPAGVSIKRFMGPRFASAADCWSWARTDFYTVRNHESYLFALPKTPRSKKRKVYWPRVAKLKKVDNPNV